MPSESRSITTLNSLGRFIMRNVAVSWGDFNSTRTLCSSGPATPALNTKRAHSRGPLAAIVRPQCLGYLKLSRWYGMIPKLIKGLGQEDICAARWATETLKCFSRISRIGSSVTATRLDVDMTGCPAKLPAVAVEYGLARHVTRLPLCNTQRSNSLLKASPCLFSHASSRRLPAGVKRLNFLMRHGQNAIIREIIGGAVDLEIKLVG